MKILVINAGSSSLKFQLLDMDENKILVKGICDRIGIDNSVMVYQVPGKDKYVVNKEMKKHKDAIALVLKTLIDEEHGVIKSTSEICGVGHRVLHGGEKFHDPVLIDEKVMDAIKECIPLGPLHNPANIMGIEGCAAEMEGIPMVAVFDTGFHQTMPKHVYTYAIPYEAYEKYSIRKYGFHGTSHKYVTQKAAEMLGKPIEELKLISCHLGNGASICAVKNGKCIDTSMGLTPLDGLVMGTRCGTLDPAVVTFLMQKEGMSAAEIDNYLNKKSGLLGVSGVSNDMRDTQCAALSGNKRAQLAIDIFTYRVKTFVGSYMAAMNGADAIIFTGGIGENDGLIRLKSLEEMDNLGINIDPEKNKIRGKEIDISTEDAKVRTLIIPTNEELAIAEETKKLISEC
ncbi:MAG: acetate kinase [Clostridiaceae bacterium]|nr:acetate kinase [Clostridiaceae bacterium]